MNNEEEYPITYKELLKKVERIEKKLNLSDFDSIGEEDEEDKEIADDLSEETLTIEQKPEIVIKPKTYLKLSKHALAYANPTIPQSEWVEVIGLLTGNIKNESTPIEHILVEDYWPVSEGNAVKVEILDQGVFSQIVENMKGKQFIVGWAHSHPSYSPFLSNEDIDTHLRYQRLWNKSIALVIDPQLISPTDYGFKIFRIDEIKGKYYAIAFEVEGLSTSAAYETLQLIMEQE